MKKLGDKHNRSNSIFQFLNREGKIEYDYASCLIEVINGN